MLKFIKNLFWDFAGFIAVFISFLFLIIWWFKAPTDAAFVLATMYTVWWLWHTVNDVKREYKDKLVSQAAVYESVIERFETAYFEMSDKLNELRDLVREHDNLLDEDKEYIDDLKQDSEMLFRWVEDIKIEVNKNANNI